MTVVGVVVVVDTPLEVTVVMLVLMIDVKNRATEVRNPSTYVISYFPVIQVQGLPVIVGGMIVIGDTVGQP